MTRAVLAAIRFYQQAISAGRPAVCRYQPTCSEYGYTAVERFGAVRGGWMALTRIVRCNPLMPGGYDPVPERSARKRATLP